MSDHADIVRAALTRDVWPAKDFRQGNDPANDLEPGQDTALAALDALVAQRDGSSFLKNCCEAALLKEERRRVSAEADRDEARALWETIDRWVKSEYQAVWDRAEAAEAERDRLAAALQDLAGTGTKHDCNPTVRIYADNPQWMASHSWWSARAQAMDDSVRARARAALAAETPMADKSRDTMVEIAREALQNGET